MKNPLFLRILVPSLTVSVSLLALGIVSAWYVQSQQREALRVEDESIRRITRVEKMVSTTRQIRFYLDRFAVSGDRENIEAVQSAYNTMSGYLDEIELLPVPKDGVALLRQIREGRIEVAAKFERLRTDPLKNARKDARELSDVATNDRLLIPAEQYLKVSTTALARSGRRMQSVADRVGLSLLLLGACGCVAGLVAGFAVARAVRMSVLELYVPIQMAQGKLEEVVGPIRLEKPGDVGEIDAILGNLAQRVETVVDRLQQSQLELLRAEQLAAIGQLAAGLAHELRNPLMAMKILIQAAAEGGEAGKLQGRDLTVLVEETSRLERAIQRFLDFARPPRLERYNSDVRGVLQQTVDLVAARATRQGVQIHQDVPDGPVTLHADPEQIRQVFLNTLLNSLDMLPKGGNIRLSLGVEESAGQNAPGGEPADRPAETTRHVVYRITDDGPGIPAELVERIFDPFVTTKEAGLGLGLAICRRIVEAHGGTIRAANVPGGGAEFLVRLPLETPAESQSQPLSKTSATA